MLPNADGFYSCSIDKYDEYDEYDGNLDTFTDIDSFNIFLCPNGNVSVESCKLLVEKYMPAKNIKPIEPCCLTVLHNSSRYLFNWKSNYEDYYLVNGLMYELQYYRRGHKENVKTANTDEMNVLVDRHEFVPETEYAVKVRSSPSQAFYRGQWSEWSSEVQWKTDPVLNDPPTNPFGVLLDTKVIVPVCMLAPFLILLCYAPFTKLKKSAFIPTPAPYFSSLYTDYQGDFKSWVLTPSNEADLLRTEQTLQIDTLTKSANILEEDLAALLHRGAGEEGPRCSVFDAASYASPLGVPYAMTPGPPQSPPTSPVKSLSLSSESESTVGDSGCWFCSDISLEKDAPWYSNEYCTLSDSVFQKAGPVVTEHQGLESSFCEVRSDRDYQNGSQ
ncbi:interleukin-21 receptor [Polymixia lowei]